MGKDILFKTDEFVFSYRVGGILVRDGKILLQRDNAGDHAVIGGHVSFLETTAETLKREYQEEIHAEIHVDDLLAVQENFFMWGNKPCHQVHFYYAVHLKQDTIPLEGVFSGYDELGGERVDLDFCMGTSRGTAQPFGLSSGDRSSAGKARWCDAFCI